MQPQTVEVQKEKINIGLGGYKPCKVKDIKLYLCLENMTAGLFTIERSQNCRNSQILVGVDQYLDLVTLWFKS